MSQTKKKIILILLFFLGTSLGILRTPSLFSQECSLKNLFSKTKSQVASPKALKTIFIRADQSPPAELVAVLLKEYLSQVKGLTLLSESEKASYEVMLSSKIYDPKHQKTRDIKELTFLLKEQTTQQEIDHFQSLIEFEKDPASVNPTVLPLVDHVTQALRIPYDSRKLIPYLNVSTSWMSYAHYAEGMALLEKSVSKTPSSTEALRSAIVSFQKAIHEDYNYVPGYLGLAEALAALMTFSQASHSPDPVATRARVNFEWEKAKLLNPVLAKESKKRMDRYLNAKEKDLCR